MAADGIANSNRVDPLGYQKINSKVVDNISSSRTYFSRMMGMGKPFSGKTMDFPITISNAGLGQFYVGLETLNSSAEDDLITLSYAHTAFTQPVVLQMLESFANAGAEQAIDLDEYKIERAQVQAIQTLGNVPYNITGNAFLSLEQIVDDGTNASTIGGQSKSTYTALKGTVTASSGTLTLAKLATLEDTISATGADTEQPNISVTTKTIWSLYEQLLSPQVRAEYASVGYNQVPLRGDSIVTPADLKGAVGFTALSFRGKPVIKDDACLSGVFYMLNERYFGWRGRTSVPDKYAGELESITLGKPSTIDGVGSSSLDGIPSSYGWFFQKEKMLPNQAGMIGRYHLIGQVVATQPRRNGKLTGITSV